jgi:hypothetical protein
MQGQCQVRRPDWKPHNTNRCELLANQGIWLIEGPLTNGGGYIENCFNFTPFCLSY